MAANVRLGIIGAGGFTRRRLLPNFLAADGIEVVAVANRTLASAERVASEFSIPHPMGDWRALLARDDVDAVLVGTEPYFHHEAVIGALEAGKHVLCQTRMAASLAEARAMHAKAEATGLKAMLVPSASFLGVRRYVKHLLDTDYVGAVRQAFGYYFVSNYIEAGAPLHRRQDHRTFGVINPLHTGIYWDVLRPWFGDPRRVLAWGGTFTPRRAESPGGPQIAVEMPDAVTVVAEMAGGPVVTCVQSGAALFGEDRIEIFGEEGTLVVPLHGGLMGARKGDEALAALEVPPEYDDSWAVEDEFVRLVRGEIDRPELSFADGVKNIEVLEATHRSMTEECWVDLPLP